MKHLYKIVFLILILFAISFFSMSVEKDTATTVYNVSGIMFSVGLGLIVSLNYSDVKNENYLKSIRNNLYEIRNIFIFYFAITTLAFLFVGKKIYISFYVSKIQYDLAFSILSVYTMIYFTINFLRIQKLNSDICDRKNEEEKSHKSKI